MKIIILIAGLLIGVPLFVVAGSMLGEMIATLPPRASQSSFDSPAYLRLPYQPVSFLTSDNLKLYGWFFPAGSADAPAIIYAPATGYDQRSGLSLVTPLHQAGFSVLLFSYRGSGESEGNRYNFSYGLAESRDVDAAVRYLSEVRGIEQIGAIGHSAGAVSIILSAARNTRLDAVIAASPYASLNEIWETSRPQLFPRPIFDLVMKLAAWRKGFDVQKIRPEMVIEKISPRPLMLIQGSADQRVTTEQALRLFGMAGGPKQFRLLEGASHHQVRFPGLDHLSQSLVGFFQQAFESDYFSARNLQQQKHIPS